MEVVADQLVDLVAGECLVAAVAVFVDEQGGSGYKAVGRGPGLDAPNYSGGARRRVLAPG